MDRSLIVTNTTSEIENQVKSRELPQSFTNIELVEIVM